KYEQAKARKAQIDQQLSLIQRPTTSAQAQKDAEDEMRDKAILAHLYDQWEGLTSLEMPAIQEFLAAVMLPLSKENLFDIQQALMQIYNANNYGFEVMQMQHGAFAIAQQGKNPELKDALEQMQTLGQSECDRISIAIADCD
uniref:DNA primase n=1 Tax=Romanomermis culicivorax TaxID=13658 RepID=A0A915HG31_ROMCU